MATAPIWPLAWEPPYAKGATQEIAKRQKKKKKRKEKEIKHSRQRIPTNYWKKVSGLISKSLSQLKKSEISPCKGSAVVSMRMQHKKWPEKKSQVQIEIKIGDTEFFKNLSE